MIRKLFSIGALIATSTLAVVPAAAPAQYYGDDGYYQQARHHDGYGYDRGRGYAREGYDDRGGYGRGQRSYYDSGYVQRGYAQRGYDRGYRRCDRGTGGTIIGAIAGGLLGNSVAGRGDRAAGTIVGAGVGALAGRAIDRGC